MSALPAFPMARRCPYAPPPEYEDLRASGPFSRVAFRGGSPVWVVTRHAQAQAVLTHPGISTDPRQPGHPFASAPGSLQGRQPGDFIDLDPPEHGRYRRPLIPQFSMRRVRELRPGIQRTVDELLDRLLTDGDSGDLVPSLGYPVATLVICQLLGVPYADRDFFHTRTARMADGRSNPEAARAAVGEVRDYLDALVTRSEKQPGDDLIGRLIVDQLRTGKLNHDDLVGMVFLLLIAGHQTTANMIPLGAFTLLRHPEVVAKLRRRPELWPGAVEELLRYHSVVDWVAFDRVATEDVEIDGHLIRSGEGLFVLAASANRDERVFPEPNAFDIERPPGGHLAFGHGTHQCLGQNLARAEIEIALRSLFERAPGLRLTAAVDELPFRFDAGTFGVDRLPVAW